MKSNVRGLSLLTVLAALALAGCSREVPSSAVAAPTAPVATESFTVAESTPPTTTAAAPATDARLAAASTPEVAASVGQNGRWKLGTNYMQLSPAQPTSVGPGKVEVIEVFWYGCGHCYQLDPFLESWKKNKPDYIEFVRIPVIWGPVHKQHARLYYTIQTLKRPDLHAKAFDEIHRKGNMLAAQSDEEARKLQWDFLKANGVSEKDFNAAYDSFSMNTNLQRAEELTKRYRVEGVPLIIVDGVYTTDVGEAGGPGKLLEVIDDLAASRRASHGTS
ncbi:MAG: thiol:disulfide interchange protein DsbA/DsbL [Pseudomonadales bacterium]|nr:thiol:disulfide interchange protein DsbA/DsbL [Pseudomonadales bacterium]